MYQSHRSSIHSLMKKIGHGVQWLSRGALCRQDDLSEHSFTDLDRYERHHRMYYSVPSSPSSAFSATTWWAYLFSNCWPSQREALGTKLNPRKSSRPRPFYPLTRLKLITKNSDGVIFYDMVFVPQSTLHRSFQFLGPSKSAAEYILRTLNFWENVHNVCVLCPVKYY